jgi:hypothetical protein
MTMTSAKTNFWGRLLSSAAVAAVLIVNYGRLNAQDSNLFMQSVAPVLRARCVQCHNEQKARGRLDLTTRDGLIKGGKTGPAIVPGSSGKSLLAQVIGGDAPRMPKQGAYLTASEVKNIQRWIDQGAPWSEGVHLAAAKKEVRVGPDWWSLRRLVRPEIPQVQNRAWVRNPIDAFILAALERKGMFPTRQADRRTLIRRLTYDVLGLPPTPDEINAFVQDKSADAYERLVERLLASPHYGERWARHWLDIVHYGDTHGYDKDKRRDHAWPYRDYVIRSLNADKPYGRFIREQIAGDVLFPEDRDAIIATGFIAAGPWDFVGHVELAEGTVEKEKTRLLDRDDMVGNTITTFMSLTIQCARCHDHKFDPILKKEYYRLQAVFAGVDRGDRPLATRLLTGPPKGFVYAVLSHAPRPIYDLDRGNVQERRELVQPGALTCIAGLTSDFVPFERGNEGSGRAQLAEWIANPQNALTWRSIVNRIWHYHFGRGIIDTPNDFGRNGGRPTHPELLDWLAVEFLEKGGSLKQLHRLILHSAAYRRSSEDNPTLAQIDSENRYLWRMNRRRLDAESVRDSILAVSGKLDRRMGGPGFELFRFKDDHSPTYDHSDLKKINDPATWRRTIYRFTVRSVPNPFLECLDCADPNLNTPVRNTTLTALQALALLNDPFIITHSGYAAERIQNSSQDLGAEIEAAYELVLGRPPQPGELADLVRYAMKNGVPNACRALMNTNEFVFVD